MADNTNIAWTEATWNPTVGCSVLSPGCTHCYAMREAHRIARYGAQPVTAASSAAAKAAAKVGSKYRGLTRQTKGGPVWTGELRFWEPALDQPLRWGRKRMIFVNSMSDLAHEDMPLDWFRRILEAMVEARRRRGHIFQVLTKRPKNLIRLLLECDVTTPIDGVWFGISVEDTRRWDERVPLLKQIPTQVPWVSVEPQLELIDRDPTGIGWAVIGGESGKPRTQARAYDLAWARVLQRRCRAARVPYFLKQLGSQAFDRGEPYPTSHYAGADPEEWPPEMRVREYPAVS